MHQRRSSAVAFHSSRPSAASRTTSSARPPRLRTYGMRPPGAVTGPTGCSSRSVGRFQSTERSEIRIAKMRFFTVADFSHPGLQA